MLSASARAACDTAHLRLKFGHEACLSRYGFEAIGGAPLCRRPNFPPEAIRVLFVSPSSHPPPDGLARAKLVRISGHPAAGSNPRSRWDGCVLRYHHDPITDVIILGVEILRLAFWRDNHAIGDSRVFVDDRAIDHAIASDSDGNFLRRPIAREFVIIGTHHDTIPYGGAALNDAANANDAALDMPIGNDTAVGNNCLSQGRAVDFAAGQKTRMSINRRLRFEKTVSRHKVGKIEISFIKSADRSDVFPVAVENVGADIASSDCGRN